MTTVNVREFIKLFKIINKIKYPFNKRNISERQKAEYNRFITLLKNIVDGNDEKYKQIMKNLRHKHREAEPSAENRAKALINLKRRQLGLKR